MVPPPLSYVAVVECSAAVEAKIGAKHGVSLREVREVVLARSVLASRWLDDEQGRRLLVRGVTRTGRQLRVVLYPVDLGEGLWRLGTAMPACESPRVEPDDTDMTGQEFDALFERGRPVTIVNVRPRFTLTEVRTSGGGLVTSVNRPLALPKIGPVHFSSGRRPTDVAG